MRKIIVEGGFHNRGKMELRVKGNHISKVQERKMEKHFCGMDDCTCGSYWRANFSGDIANDEQLERSQDGGLAIIQHYLSII